ncbi:MAG: GtrA family protein [Allosphingosinicella sp.]
MSGLAGDHRRAGAFRPVLARLLSFKAAAMLGRNTVVSCFTFLTGLALMWALVEKAATGKVPAAAISFLFATSLHYLLGRSWIFKGTDRGVTSGYVYFLINAGLGLVVTTGLFAAMIALTPINYLVARILVSLVAGLVMFLLNATLNFRRL